MDDEIKKVFKVPDVKADRPFLIPDKRRKKRENKKQGEVAGKHFKRLAKAAEEAHAVLVREKAPYRFCVYEEDGEVFIDLLLLDEHGKTREVKKKNITHEEFLEWIGHIERGGGLILDSIV
ncbi:MAG: hypothetical protein K9L30_15055 [Desulfobacterales bacterium]|nr:hypothetical protein [Desulfobacterales bacterium]